MFTLGNTTGEVDDPLYGPPSMPPGGVEDPVPTPPCGDNDFTAPHPPSRSDIPPSRCLPELTPAREYVGEFNLSGYYRPHENQARWKGTKIPIKASSTKDDIGKYLTKEYNHYATPEKEPYQCKPDGDFLCAKQDFLEAYDSVCMQGSGVLETGEVISCSENPPAFEWYQRRDVREFYTVARYKYSKLLRDYDKIYIDAPWFIELLRDHGNTNGELLVTDTGEGLYTTDNYESIDLYLGSGSTALDLWFTKFSKPDSENKNLNGKEYWPVYRIVYGYY